MDMKKRMMKYLERHYSILSVAQQKSKLIEILQRLKALNFLDEETLQEVVKAFQTEENWPLSRVLAHLDMIDLDERT